MITLENDLFRVQINEFGAELTSIVSKKTGIEYVWQGDPTYWKRHAPVLFPIVGRLKDLYYTVGGEKYEITQHGFGRDLPFQATQESDTCASFTLRQSDYTRKMYPYDFTFVVRYTLEGSALRKEHITANDSTVPLYYEVGGHDAYTLCWNEGEAVHDYYAAFEGDEVLHPIITDENVLLTEKHGSLPLQEGRLPLSAETFRNDALMLDDLTVRRVSIGCTKNNTRVTIEFTDFPYFALWSTYKGCEVPYLCLEPWSTLPDGDYLNHALEQKCGIRRLKPGLSETLCFTTTITEA